MTEAEQACLAAIASREAGGQLPPTISELCVALGRIRSAVHETVVSLERQGWIIREAGRTRSIRVARRSVLRDASTADLTAELRRRGEWPA